MMQCALDFSPPRLERGPAPMRAAQAMGDAATEAGAEKARRVDPAFIERAGQHMLGYLRVHGTSSGELLTDFCKLANIRPPDDRHFGAVTQNLIRRGLIHWAGDCKRVKGHASRGGSLYALGPKP